jgi:hypothetical protein
MANIELGRVSTLREQHDTLVLNTNQPFGLQDLAYEVKQAIPGCCVTPADDIWSWVYTPDDYYAMGMIGYGDFRSRQRGPRMYTVRARNIDNGKYSEGSIHRHMKMSASRHIAVKNARTHLRRYTPLEMLVATRAAVRLRADAAALEGRQFLRTLEKAAFGFTLYAERTPPFLAELKYLLDSGYAFIDQTLAGNLRTYFKGVAELDASKGSARDFMFVHVSTYCGAPRIDLLGASSGGDSVINSYHSTPPDMQTYYGSEIAEHVSEDVMGKIAMLNMLEDNAYVAGVGYKVLEGIYYVAW